MKTIFGRDIEVLERHGFHGLNGFCRGATAQAECGRPGHSDGRGPEDFRCVLPVLANGRCCAWGRAHSGEKRRRAAAVQDARRLPATHELRKASGCRRRREESLFEWRLVTSSPTKVKRLPATYEPREASWSAPALWRFRAGGEPGKVNDLGADEKRC
jgi:hypothetical protein